MSKRVSLLEYMEQSGLQDEEKRIILDYIGTRELSERTEKERAYMYVRMSGYLHEIGSSFVTLTTDDIIALSKRIKKDNKPNTRQTYVSNLKAIAKYISKKHHKIEGLFDELPDIKAGAPEPGEDKTVLTQNDWLTLLNRPGLTVRDRAILQLLYDGYHRPGEILELKWSDFKVSNDGNKEYNTKFKTGKIRHIGQSAETTRILDEWRKWLGTVPDDSPVFPDRHGNHYSTIQMISNTFRKFGIENFTPSCVRPTAITHDVSDADNNTTAVCLKAWGKPSSELISTYAAKVDSLKLQREQQERNRKKRGIPDVIEPVKPFGMSDKQGKEMVEMQKRMKDMEDWIAVQEEAMRRMSGERKQ